MELRLLHKVTLGSRVTGEKQILSLTLWFPSLLGAAGKQPDSHLHGPGMHPALAAASCGFCLENLLLPPGDAVRAPTGEGGWLSWAIAPP